MTNEQIIMQQFESVGFNPTELIVKEVGDGDSQVYLVTSINEKHWNSDGSPATVAVVSSLHDPSIPFVGRAMNAASTLKAFIASELGEFA